MKNLLLLCCLTALIPLAAHANRVTIQVADFQFSPNSVTVNLGDTVVWTWSNGSHTSTSTSVPSGGASWDVQITSTSTSFAYVPTVKGSYSYKCTPHASMGMTGSFTVVQGGTSVAPVANSGLLVSPSPASGTLMVGLPSACNVSLVDISGKAVFSLKSASGMLAIPVAEFPAGIYILQCISDSRRDITRVRIEH